MLLVIILEKLLPKRCSEPLQVLFHTGQLPATLELVIMSLIFLDFLNEPFCQILDLSFFLVLSFLGLTSVWKLETGNWKIENGKWGPSKSFLHQIITTQPPLQRFPGEPSPPYF